MDGLKTKNCKNCRKDKPLEGFPIAKGNMPTQAHPLRDGRRPICNDCAALAQAAWIKEWERLTGGHYAISRTT